MSETVKEDGGGLVAGIFKVEDGGSTRVVHEEDNFEDEGDLGEGDAVVVELELGGGADGFEGGGNEVDGNTCGDEDGGGVENPEDRRMEDGDVEDESSGKGGAEGEEEEGDGGGSSAIPTELGEVLIDVVEDVGAEEVLDRIRDVDPIKVINVTEDLKYRALRYRARQQDGN